MKGASGRGRSWISSSRRRRLSSGLVKSGRLEITVSTSGTDLDGYLVSVDAGPVQPISINGTLTITNVAAGIHSIQLSDLDGDCTVTGQNPETMNVAAGGVASPEFEVNCGT